MNTNAVENIEKIDVLTTPEKKEINRNAFYIIIKRMIDIIGGLFGTILLIPITLAVAIARIVTKENDGPIFYEQVRIGKNGKVFRLYKYRSMVIGADEILNKYLLENDEVRKEYKVYKKLKDDPRITKVGKFLRKTSLDEFPQFINVLKGEMSLVGPRPYLPRERTDMKGYYKTIISVKPGVTGLWQIMGRSNVTFKERMDIDKEYIKNRSLILDIKIFIKTFIKVFKKEGAN